MGRAHEDNPKAIAVLAILLCFLLVVGLLGGSAWWMYRRSMAAAEVAMEQARRAEEIERSLALRELVAAHAGAPASRTMDPVPEEPVAASRPADAVSVRVSGRVVDTDGTPQFGVGVRFVQPGKRPGITVESGPDGGFTFPAPLSTGEWLVFIDRDRQLVRPTAFTLGAQPEALVEVVVAKDDPALQIHGRVVDATARPVAGAEVAALSGAEELVSRTFAGPDGAFVLRRAQRGAQEARARLRAIAPGFADHTDDAQHPWGTRDVLVTLQRGIDCSLRVVVAGSDQAVERFKMTVVAPEAAGSGRSAARAYDGSFPGGLVTFIASRRGPHRAAVEPEDPTLGLSGQVEFMVGDAPVEPVLIEVPSQVPLRITVATRAGTPVAGSRIELVRQERPDLWRIDMRAQNFAAARSMGMGMARGQFVWLLAEGLTDETGRVTLLAPRCRAPLAVRALGPGHVPGFAEPPVLGPAGGDVPIVVEQGATLTGTLAPVAVLAALERFTKSRSPRTRTPPGLRLVRTGDGAVRVLPMAGGRLTPEADGRFHWTGIPAGTWTLQLSWDVAFPDESGGSSANATLDVVRELRDGESRELRCDLSALVPASLSGQVFLDGQPFALGRVTLWTWIATRGGGSRSEVRVRTDGEGRFQVAALRPGAYRVVIDIRDEVSGRELNVDGREPVTLSPGQDAEHTFVVERLRARLRFVSAIDERPLSNHQVSLRDANGSWAQDLVTDADGQLVLDPARPGQILVWALRVGVTPEERRKAGLGAVAPLIAELGSIEVPPGKSEATFTLRVPGR